VSDDETSDGWVTLNAVDLAAAKRRDEECRQLAIYERQKQLDLERRELMRDPFIEKLIHGGEC
jgi:hypothetical protein